MVGDMKAGQIFNLYIVEVGKTGCSYIYSVKDRQQGQKKILDKEHHLKKVT